MNESCHIWMSHVTYEWVVPHMNESCHIWMSHVTYEWVMSHMNKSHHIWMSHVTYEWVVSHMNESCHIWMSPITYEWVMSHMNESCHIWMSHSIRDSTSVPACAPANYIAHGMQWTYSVECRCGVRVCVAVWCNVLQCSQMSTQLHCMSCACALPFCPLRLCEKEGTQDIRVQLVWKRGY